jgi:hypothetical protein
MAEVWLRTNRRALLWGMLPAAVIAVAGGWLAVGYWPVDVWGRMLGVALIAIAAAALVALAWQLRQPRLAYADGHVAVFLRRGQPIRVPVHVIECFLLGQAPSQLPSRGRRLKTRTVLIRLCPQAAEWVRGDVDPRLGQWRDSFFVVHGAWCEPLNVEVVQRLNAKLGQAQRARRAEEDARRVSSRQADVCEAQHAPRQGEKP